MTCPSCHKDSEGDLQNITLDEMCIILLLF